MSLEEKIKDIILLDPDIHKVPDTHIMNMILETVQQWGEEAVESNDEELESEPIGKISSIRNYTRDRIRQRMVATLKKK